MITLLVAGISYVGQTYYTSLFGRFGLDPAILEMGQIQVATSGFNSAFLALVDAVRRGIKPALIGVGIAIVFGLSIVIFRDRVKSAFSQDDLERFANANNVALRWIIRILGVCLIGLVLLSGPQIAGWQESHIRAAAREHPLCYYTEDEVLAGRILGQSASITILKRADDTRVFQTSGLERVADCKGPSRDA